jgi:hypothetical protein
LWCVLSGVMCHAVLPVVKASVVKPGLIRPNYCPNSDNSALNTRCDGHCPNWQLHPVEWTRNRLRGASGDKLTTSGRSAHRILIATGEIHGRAHLPSDHEGPRIPSADMLYPHFSVYVNKSMISHAYCTTSDVRYPIDSVYLRVYTNKRVRFSRVAVRTIDLPTLFPNSKNLCFEDLLSS